jgi:hypothetical protein
LIVNRQQKLNLLQFAAWREAKPSAGSSKIVGRQLAQPDCRRVLCYDVPICTIAGQRYSDLG